MRAFHSSLVPLLARLLLTATLAAGLLTTGPGCIPIQNVGTPETGFFIKGYVGHSSQQAAIGEVVTLLDAATGAPVGSVQTDWMGGFVFGGLEPGRYALQVGAVTREVLLGAQDLRVDIDLSAPGGVMNYAAAPPAPKKTQPAGAARGSGEGMATTTGTNDASLQQWIAGTYYSYSGANTMSGGGGSERRLVLCANGRFRFESESSYYGSDHNQYGDQTMSWGSAGQGGGGGSWSIEGSRSGGTLHLSHDGGKQESVAFQAKPDNCFDFWGYNFCYEKGAACD
jgi:hypothetical protein